MQEADFTPAITPLAKRLAEDAGVAWHALPGTDGFITETDVLEHLTRVVTSTLTAPPSGPAEPVDFSSLAASLAEVVQELLAGTDEAVTPPAASTSASESPGVGLAEQPEAQLEAERLAHAQTRRQLSALEETLKQQKVRAAQLRPLSAEIRRLGSALGVANAKVEQLRPLEGLVASLQQQLEEVRADEARVRLLCRELQAQQDLLEQRKQRSHWQFWKRTS